MHTLFAIAYGILAVMIVVSLFISSWELIKCFDVKFDKKVAEANGRDLNLKKARSQQAVLGRFV